MFAFAIDKKMVEVAELMIIPKVGKINWGLDIKNAAIVILIILFGFFRLSCKAKPYGPFI